ncbi:MAG: hypothetical protein ACRDJH_13905 [Thermomicrobiales bacterium]
MPRICPACAGRIEDIERFQECSACHRNYHLDHRCPEHPRANMLVISPNQSSRPVSDRSSPIRTTIFRPIQSPTVAPAGQRPRIPALALTPRRNYRKPVAAGSALVVVLAVLALGVLTPVGLPFIGPEADSTRPAGETVRERSAPTSEDDAEVTNPPRPTNARDQDASNAIATRDARQELAELKFGPDSGRLAIESDADGPVTHASGVRLRDPMVRARLFTPSEAESEWDYGIAFRRTGEFREYRLIVTSGKEWFCDLIDGDPAQPVSRQSGTLTGVDTQAGEHNDLHLIVIGDVGYFFINDRYVATLDLSAKLEAGDVAVGSGFLPAHQSPGQSTKFENFEVAARSQG